MRRIAMQGALLRNRSHRHLPLLVGVAAVFAIGALATAAPAGKPATAGKSKGFIVSTWIAAAYAGADDCPTGLTLDAIPAYLATISPEENARLNRPENAGELSIKASGNA